MLIFAFPKTKWSKSIIDDNNNPSAKKGNFDIAVEIFGVLESGFCFINSDYPANLKRVSKLVPDANLQRASQYLYFRSEGRPGGRSPVKRLYFRERLIHDHLLF